MKCQCKLVEHLPFSGAFLLFLYFPSSHVLFSIMAITLFIYYFIGTVLSEKQASKQNRTKLGVLY